MIIVVAERGCRWLESGEDQVFADINNVVQAPESDMMARSVALDLLKVAFRVRPKREAAEHEELAGRENPLDVAVWHPGSEKIGAPRILAQRSR